MNKFLQISTILLFGIAISLSACKSKKSAEKGDIPEKTEKKTEGPKAFAKVITKEAKSDSGLFNYYKTEDKFYLEIPEEMLGREMLVVTRIAKTADKIGYGGENTDNTVLRWEKRENTIYARVVSYNNVASDSLAIYESVKNSNFEPILMSFDVEAFGKDSTSYVIEISDWILGDVKPFGLDESRRKSFKVSSIDKKRSYVESVKSFPENIELRRVLTYNASKAPSNSTTGAISLLISNSMILLPETPMMPRAFDRRVGFFSLQQTDYGTEEQRAAKRKYIVRWKLEPKDPEAFRQGELVEPVKQIVYYIDPATPEKWRPFLIQGVNDWNIAFEAAGFKNAIVAKNAPTPEEDPDWSAEDSRYSVIRYFASDIQNAYGPNVHDPRSGEILESDIGWYHNVMNLLRNWYFIQTSAINPGARMAQFDDETMGQLIRFVSSHEVGHTLGLPHNMGASSSYPVDSLRSAKFTQEMGTAPSIMDYARFNYIAQPEDEGVYLYPKIGMYDKYAVNWGYRPILDAKTPEDEKRTLDKWILEHKDDRRYQFGTQRFQTLDPRAQTEDLGDDAAKASEYGIANLKRIIPNLLEWLEAEGEDYDDLEELYGQVANQLNRYTGHVQTSIGGVYENYKTFDQSGAVYTHVEKEKQERAMRFLIQHLWETPTWLIDRDILGRIEYAGMIDRIRKLQVNRLNSTLEFNRLGRVIENVSINGEEAYSLIQLMEELRNGIWSELKSGEAIDNYRRNLQRAHIERLEYIMITDETPLKNKGILPYISYVPIDVSQSDIRAVALAELTILKNQVKVGKKAFSDSMTIYHLDECLNRIEKILDPSK
ncbi:MAG: hypothetical protein ACJAZ3_001138 [Sphingobacteriales bacterium]|jgi:hypothetical protein